MRNTQVREATSVQKLFLLNTNRGKPQGHTQHPLLRCQSLPRGLTAPHSSGRGKRINSHHTEYRTKRNLVQPSTYQIIIWSDPKELAEIAKGHWSVGFEPKVIVVVSWGQVTPFTDQGEKHTRVFVFGTFLKKLPSKQTPTGWILTQRRDRKQPPSRDTRRHTAQQACACSHHRRWARTGKTPSSAQET